MLNNASSVVGARNIATASARTMAGPIGALVLGLVLLLAAGCGTEDGHHSAAASSTSSFPTSTSGLPSGAALPDGSPAPAPLQPCNADHLLIQTASPVPVGEGQGLFVRLFNRGDVCWLDGRLRVSLRDRRGTWNDLAYRLGEGPTTNGPTWTGRFDPALVGVVVFGESTPGASRRTTYDGLRLTLPNGGGVLEHEGIEMTLSSEELTVYPIEADSQDR